MANVTSPEMGWPLAVGVSALIVLAIAVSWWGRLHIERDVMVAAARAVVQLAAISLVIGWVLPRTWASVGLALVMFIAAVFTATQRIGATGDQAWVSTAMAPAVLAVVLIIFGTGAAPFTGASIVSIVGIVIGNTMTAVGLAGRRFFEAIEAETGQIEAAVALGLTRPFAIRLVTERRANLALSPVLDQTRTVGLVTLPGAFVGVLLGGGSAMQAAASQLLVLIGIIAAQSIVVVLLQHLIASARVLSPAAADALPPG